MSKTDVKRLFGGVFMKIYTSLIFLSHSETRHHPPRIEGDPLETFDYNHNSQSIFNTHCQRFSETAETASRIKDVIEVCLSANIRAHSSLLVAVEKDLEELVFQTMFLHNNHSYNVMMCIGETVDKYSNVEDSDKDLFSDVVTRYFEMGMEQVLADSQMQKNLSSMLLHNKSKRAMGVEDKLEAALSDYVGILTIISQGCKFLGSLGSNPKLTSSKVKQEVIDAITNYTIKSKELAHTGS